MKIDGDDLSLFRLALTSSPDIFEKEISSKEFNHHFGAFYLKVYKTNPYFYLKTELETQEINDLTANEIKIIWDNSQSYFWFIQELLSFLWFIKDNSATVDTFHTYMPDAKKASVQNNQSVYSSCTGKINEEVRFTDIEIKKAADLYFNYTQLLHRKKFIINKVGDKIPPLINTNINRTPKLGKDINRLERAIDFLNLARTNSNLYLKISMYICIYETLFNGKGAEIAHQIGERVALYHSNSSFFRPGIYKLIKDAYGIRSRYFHGNELNFTNENLSKISSQLDYQTREILTKIINEDSKIFLQSDELLERSFLDLIFEDERTADGLTVSSNRTYHRFNETDKNFIPYVQNSSGKKGKGKKE